MSRAGWTAFGVTMAYRRAVGGDDVAFPRLLIAPSCHATPPTSTRSSRSALSFLQIAALFQLFDGAQAALANMLRGVHDSRWPAVMALVGYWAIGAPVGVGARFLHPAAAASGLWIGLAFGLAAVALLLFVRWRARTERISCARRTRRSARSPARARIDALAAVP